jgi:hypothetical protein
MAAFLPEVSVIDAIVALVAIEALFLIFWRTRTGGGVPIAGMLANLSSGAALLLSLRMALAGAAFDTVLALLSIALVAHLGDLASRWQAASARPSANASILVSDLETRSRAGL